MYNPEFVLENKMHKHQIIMSKSSPCDFFTPSLAVGILLDSVWQQVSSGLQDSSEYCHYYYYY